MGAWRWLLLLLPSVAGRPAWDSSQVVLNTAAQHCPADYFKVSPLLWPCSDGAVEGTFNLQQGGPNVFHVPKGVSGFSFAAESRDDLEITVRNRSVVSGESDLVLRASASESNSKQLPTWMVSVQRTKTAHGSQALLRFWGTPESAIGVVLQVPPNQERTKVTIRTKHVDAKPCPQAPVGCAKYDEEVARQAVESWSCWARQRYGNEHFALAFFTGSLGHPAEGPEVGGVSSTQWDAAWEESPLAGSFDAGLLFRYLDGNTDDCLDKWELHNALEMCKLPSALRHGHSASPWLVAFVGIIVFGGAGVLVYHHMNQKPDEVARDIVVMDEVQQTLLKQKEFEIAALAKPNSDGRACDRNCAQFDKSSGTVWDCLGRRSWGGSKSPANTRPTREPAPLPPERFGDDSGYAERLMRTTADGAAVGWVDSKVAHPEVAAVAEPDAFLQTPLEGLGGGTGYAPQDEASSSPVFSWAAMKVALESDELPRQVDAMQRIRDRCHESSEAQDQAMTVIGAQLVLQVVEEYPTSSEMQVAGCGAVFRMCEDNPQCAGQFAFHRAVETLIQVLKAHYDGSPEISDLACWSVLELMKLDECREEFVNEQGQKYVAMAMDNQISDPGVAEAGCHVIASLANNYAVREKLAEGTIMQQVPQALNQHLEDAGVVEAACRAIEACCGSALLAEKLADFAAVALLEKAARQHRETGALTDAIASAAEALNAALPAQGGR